MQMTAITQLTKNNIFILIFCITLIGCTKQKKTMYDVFYTAPNEYWQYYYSGEYTGPNYLKFNKNNTSDNVGIEKDGFKITNSEGDVVGMPLEWSVSKDTILTWGERKYDIVSYDEKIIILYIQGRSEPGGKITSGMIYLVKGMIENIRREPGYFEYKRELYPEKYKEKWGNN